MSGMMNKVKSALNSDKHSNEPGQTTTGGTSDSVAHGSSVGETNPGFLHSTERGIHGDRDPGTGATSGYDNRTGGIGGSNTTGTGLGNTGVGGSSAVTGDHHKHGQQFDPTSISSRDRPGHSDITSTAAAAEAQDYDKYDRGNKHQEPLMGGAAGHRGHDTSSRLPGHTTDTNTTNPTDLAGTGSGYDSNNRDRGIVTGAGTGSGGVLGGTGRDTTGIGSTGGGQTGYGTGATTTSGPHDSNLANKADPRVDSDRDGSRGYGSGTTSGTAMGSGTDYGSGTTSGYGTSDTGVGSGSNTTSGPHKSNILNKADPRVDSDRDGSRNLGASQTSGTGVGSGTTHGSNITGQTTGLEKHFRGDGHSEDIVHPGPHLSETAKKLDPHTGL